jgi:hypothetical protein
MSFAHEESGWKKWQSLTAKQTDEVKAFMLSLFHPVP